MNPAMIKSTIPLFLVLWFSSTLVGQSTKSLDHLDFLREQLLEKKRTHELPTNREETNEIKLGVQLFFRIYKNYFSSQDSRRCAFAPSCSVYCIQSVHSMGPFFGVLNAFDRLTRCNSLSPENYTIDRKTGIFLDPLN